MKNIFFCLLDSVELQKVILDGLHEGPQGIIKCRALARDTLYWPDLSKQMPKKVEEYAICETDRSYPTEALQLTTIPDYP